MRCITKEMLEKREKADSVYNLILHAPKPDFTELDNSGTYYPACNSYYFHHYTGWVNRGVYLKEKGSCRNYQRFDL